MKSVFEILLGLVLIIGIIYFNYKYPVALWQATKTVLVGGVVCMIAMIGLLFLLLGISELKE
jgi:hypothetical protein